MIKKINMLIHDGILHIVGASTINKIFSLCSGIIIVRVLSKTDYGVYSYILNIVNIVLLLNGMGTLTGIIQYGCENGNVISKKNAFMKFGFKIGMIFNCILSICIVIYGIAFPQSISNTSYLFVLAAFIPVTVYVAESFCSFLRVNEENKIYSYFTMVNSFLTLAFILIGAFLLGVPGAITFRYFATIIEICIGVFLLKSVKSVFASSDKLLILEEKKSFIKFSMISCANTSIGHLFYNADIFLIGLLIANADIIASYKVASTIPLALVFITVSIMTYVYPKFVKNRNNAEWISKNYRSMLCVLTFINGGISIICYVFSTQIVGLIFGQPYIESATPIFRILIVGFFISSTLRTPSGWILDMLHLVKPNLYISLISGVVNIGLDIVLIKSMGCIGAAIATTSTYLMYGLLSNWILFRYIGKMRKREIK